MLETMTAQLWQIYMLKCHNYDVQKWSDTVHTKRSLTCRLYNLKECIRASKLYPNCSVLSQKVISYFAKCFRYAISQNAGNPHALKALVLTALCHKHLVIITCATYPGVVPKKVH